MIKWNTYGWVLVCDRGESSRTSDAHPSDGVVSASTVE